VNFQSAIYRNNGGTPSGLPVWTSGSTAGARAAAIGDVNGDGLPDIVIGYGSSRLFHNNGDGTFAQAWQATPPFSGVQELMLVDVNNDGWLDVIETHFSDGRTHIYLNNNGTLSTTPSWTYDAVPLGTSIDFGDLNNDGCPDLVIGYSGQPSLVVFYAQNCDPSTPCPADIAPPGGDGAVNVNDLLAVINAWGPCPTSGPCPADIAPPGGDGTVNVNDLLAVINAWGPCP
jgi:hypothetical protein